MSKIFNISNCAACPFAQINNEFAYMRCGVLDDEFDFDMEGFDPDQDIHPACPFYNKNFQVQVNLIEE